MGFDKRTTNVLTTHRGDTLSEGGLGFGKVGAVKLCENRHCLLGVGQGFIAVALFQQGTREAVVIAGNQF